MDLPGYSLHLLPPTSQTTNEHDNTAITPTALFGLLLILNESAKHYFVYLFSGNKKDTEKQAGRRLDSAPSPNFVAMAIRVGPQHFVWFHRIGHPENPLVGANICVLSAIQGNL